MDDGWRIEAYLPKRVAPIDRIKILERLDSYSSQVREQHPQWVTRFRAADQAYFLDIRQVDTPKDVVEMAKTLQRELWHQLTLDYA